jgi:ubiquinone/menaquinone biosynthesis C-methylase UbiE
MSKSFDYDRSNVSAVYDTSRALPRSVIDLWLDAIAELIDHDVNKVLDLGCGTGRFSIPLANRFSAEVLGVDPSSKQLDIAHSSVGANDSVTFLQGTADNIPLQQSVDLVFLSMAYHHIPEKQKALSEIARVIVPGGSFVIRNATVEDIDHNVLFDFFPEAREIERDRMPTMENLLSEVEQAPFRLVKSTPLHQRFASSYMEYYEKISQRGLSALRMISDEQFNDGLSQFRRFCEKQKSDKAVVERFHLFVFARS